MYNKDVGNRKFMKELKNEKEYCSRVNSRHGNSNISRFRAKQKCSITQINRNRRQNTAGLSNFLDGVNNMKYLKYIFAISAISAVMLSAVSCKKAADTITETVNQTAAPAGTNEAFEDVSIINSFPETTTEEQSTLNSFPKTTIEEQATLNQSTFYENETSFALDREEDTVKTYDKNGNVIGEYFNFSSKPDMSGLPELSKEQLQQKCEEFMSQYVDIKKYTLDDCLGGQDSSDDSYTFEYSYHKIKDMRSSDSFFMNIYNNGTIINYKIKNAGIFDNFGNIPSVDYNALNNEVDRLAKEKYGQNIEYTTKEPVLSLADGRPCVAVAVSPQNYEYGELYDFLIPLM